jgi:hypothetical protein
MSDRGVRHALKRSRQGLQDWFRPRPDPRLGRGNMNVQSLGSPTGTHSRQFRYSILGVLGKCDIWMRVPRRVIEYTIGSKVVASPEFGPWWVKWVRGRPWLVPTPKGCRMSFNQLVLVCDADLSKWKACPRPSFIPGLLARPSHPPPP